MHFLIFFSFSQIVRNLQDVQSSKNNKTVSIVNIGYLNKNSAYHELEC